MKTAVFFSQSPSDLKYVLSIYEQYKNKYRVKIYVVGIKSNYLFLKNTLPKIEVEYIQTPTTMQIFFNPFHLIKIRTLKRRICSENKNNLVFFFSRYIDYYTTFFIDNLKIQNSVFYIDSVYSFLDANISYIADNCKLGAGSVLIKPCRTKNKILIGAPAKINKNEKFIYFNSLFKRR